MDRGTALPFRDLGARRGGWSAPHPDRFTPRERPGTPCTGGWVGPTAGLDVCEKSHPHWDFLLHLFNRIRSPDRPARSQSLYRLSYPAHFLLPWKSQNVYTRCNKFISVTLKKGKTVLGKPGRMGSLQLRQTAACTESPTYLSLTSEPGNTPLSSLPP
jgi:hypothetical protein